MIEYDGMTENDTDNLNFLLNATQDVLRDWLNHVDEDDIDYAIDLLQMFQLRIIDIIATHDLTQTKDLLSKYSLT